MKKLLILSGKGGTGKTTTAAAFISFLQTDYFADCDVDAPNLHFVVSQRGNEETVPYYGMEKAHINESVCTQCGKCAEHCRFDAVKLLPSGEYMIDEYACEGCGVCKAICPVSAVSLEEDVAGSIKTCRNSGVFASAILKMGRGNSGKLVTEVKSRIPQNPKDEVAVIDGSPGIGCPVIASISGTDLVLIVAEPSVSGISDLRRIVKTAGIFVTPVAVCVNKADADKQKTQQIKDFCRDESIPFVGTVPFDEHVLQAVNSEMSVAEIDCPARDSLHEIYENTLSLLTQKN